MHGLLMYCFLGKAFLHNLPEEKGQNTPPLKETKHEKARGISLVE